MIYVYNRLTHVSGKRDLEFGLFILTWLIMCSCFSTNVTTRRSSLLMIVEQIVLGV